MMKRKIFIDVNEVIRATWAKFDENYVREFGEEEMEAKHTLNFFDDYSWKPKKEELNILKDDAPELLISDYVQDENGESKADFITFNKEVIDLSPKEVYYEFMQDYSFQIYGCANPVYRNIDVDIHKFMLKYPDFEYVLFSKEDRISVSKTLFFLSKLNLKVKKYYFIKEYSELEYTNNDIVITTDPNILNTIEYNSVKIIREYNESINHSLSVNNIIDLYENVDFENYINKLNENL